MTQQEAYVRLNELFTEAQQLITEHKLISAFTSRDQEVPETISPDWINVEHREAIGYDGQTRIFTKYLFKDPLPADAVDYFIKTRGFVDEQEVQEAFAGQNIYNGWMPSQYC